MIAQLGLARQPPRLEARVLRCLFLEVSLGRSPHRVHPSIEDGAWPQRSTESLWLTAALVGAVTRKDLVAAFRRVNPVTMFDVERAHKWLQGRAQPRERRVYEDWALLVDLGAGGMDRGGGRGVPRSHLHPAHACTRHTLGRETLLRRAEAFGGGATRGREVHGRALELVGTYVCYSHAFSPYNGGSGFWIRCA